MSTPENRVLVIRAQLEAISRGSSPKAEQVGIWLKELEGIPFEDLEARIKQARDEHAEKLARGTGWGHITPDDVLTVHRRLKRAEEQTTGGPPSNPDCVHGCLDGRVSLIDPDGYDVCVRCSCFAGNYWRANRALGKGRDAEMLLREGYSYARSRRAKLPPEHVEWIQKRADQVGFMRAISEYRNHEKASRM